MPRSTVRHLRTAIYEALTTATGKPRALPRLFQRGLPAGVDRKLRSVRAHPLPGVFVIVARARREPGLAQELGSDHHFRFEVVLSRDYYLGFEHSIAEVEATMERVSDDFMAICAALGMPGSLVATAGNEPTGLADGALDVSDAESIVVIEQIGDGRDRLVNVRDRFIARFLFDPDPAPAP